MNDYITTDQVVNLLGTLGIKTSRIRIYNQVKNGGLPARKIGRSYYYKRDDVLAWLEAKK